MHGFPCVCVYFPFSSKNRVRGHVIGVFMHQRRMILKEFKDSISQGYSLVKENASNVLEFIQQ